MVEIRSNQRTGEGPETPGKKRWIQKERKKVLANEKKRIESERLATEQTDVFPMKRVGR
ncbi:MAG: hypothetical protein AB7S77_16160 [Desulfatirhabdiaceae bacterium]